MAQRRGAAALRHAVFRTALPAAGALIWALASASPAAGAKPWFRRFAAEAGLGSENVYGLTQDAHGFIWIGTHGGLFRYDGAEIRPWPNPRGNRGIYGPAASPSGEVVAFDDEGGLVRVEEEGLTPLPTPSGAESSAARDLAFDRAGHLWVAYADGLHRRDAAGGAWTRLPAQAFGGEELKRLLPQHQGGLLVGTASSIWALGDLSGAPPIRLASGLKSPVAARLGDRVIIVGARPPDRRIHLFELTPHGRRDLAQLANGNVWDITVRGETVWFTYERFLGALDPDGSVRALGPADGLPSAGALFVDGEGSLWLGTSGGLLHFPEPDTLAWKEEDGLPNVHTRVVGRLGSEVVVSTWTGLGILARTVRGWRMEGFPTTVFNLCADGAGRAWGAVAEGFVVRDSRGFTTLAYPDLGYGNDCAAATGGRVWIATGAGLFLSPRSSGSPMPVPSPLARNGSHSALVTVLESESGTLFVTRGNEVCEAPASRVASGDAVAWSCALVGPPLVRVDRLIVTDRGNLWAGSERGIFRRREHGWEPIPGVERLTTRIVADLSHSPRGGVWVVGPDMVVRVEDRPDLPEGWRELERIGRWQGLPAAGGHNIHEDDDGTLWLASDAGLVRIPPAARPGPAVPPRVELVDMRVNDLPRRGGVLPHLDHRHNVLAARVAALTFRDRSLLRARMRLGTDGSWKELSGLPLLNFVDLGFGEYYVQVEASLDGERWSAVPASARFTVDAPWYLRWWFLAGLALAGAGTFYAIHRVRVGVLVRLERQRARIAMDLHDEMGSGLGTIAILADLSRDAGTSHPDRGELIGRIGVTAQELTAALTDIVWALRPQSARLDALAYHLAERGGRLFPGPRPEFGTTMPDPVPAVPVTLAIRRNAFLIGLEALQNAAKHSRAERVTLGLSEEGRRWRLWVRDDGRGIAAAGNPEAGHGSGLSGMRRRADAIGARFEISSAAGGGTTVTLVFDPRAEERGRQAAGTT